jgi:hypothetical protein
MWIKFNNTTYEVVETCINQIANESGYTVLEVNDSDMPNDLMNTGYGFAQYKFIEDGYGSGVFEKYCCEYITDCEEACADEGEEKETYLDVRKNNYMGFYDGISVTASGTEYFSFPVPFDFLHLHELKLIGIAETGGADKQIDLYSQYGGIGQAYDYSTETSEGGLFNLGSANEKIAIDISPVFSGIVAEDTCALKIVHQSIGGKIYYQHIKMRYHSQ